MSLSFRIDCKKANKELKRKEALKINIPVSGKKCNKCGQYTTSFADNCHYCGKKL